MSGNDAPYELVMDDCVGGHISLIGVLTGRQGEVPTARLMGRQVRLQGLVVGNRRQQQEYVAALEASNVRPVMG